MPLAMKKRRTHSEAEQVTVMASSQTSAWPYHTEYGDHFETSDEALKHLEPALYRCAQWVCAG